ncbi:MAG TPA: hypothetical protein VML50_09150 [Anaeromyxobacter sp.]|nr:hypothetical protein [Anaeromyxobacter sp.]
MKPLLAFALGLLPGAALACPACARDSVPHLALLLGSMIAAPYLVVAAVTHAIRGGGH